MYEYEDPSRWMPEPVRPQGQLTLLFIASVVFFPVLVVVWLAAFAVLLAVGLLTEVIAAFSDRYEQGFLKLMDRTLDLLAGLASWCVTWPELRHEGDTAYYRARVDKVVARWTARASAPARPNRVKPPVECAIRLRDYRGVGGGYVTEAARAQGWELRPTDVRKEVRLRWAAASQPAPR
ncbi:membrane protein [Streptomyces viridochromogenes]|uniref:Membrane protein n=1 Tax=Streptomyces viridochromogenes TaxID=1938 RepID=A0A0J8C5W0_STRVR|nr:hypothetical protein [Streptomyces viridochromogenes]KMS73250.1 membrane protein [Streptomyces viridochromogenes]KOG17422.1 membrane protein [Streptomyces viridochromogenes]KOG18407.1 membrane protein [Streptomyces viridochromogenes]